MSNIDDLEKRIAAIKDRLDIKPDHTENGKYVVLDTSRADVRLAWNLSSDVQNLGAHGMWFNSFCFDQINFVDFLVYRVPSELVDDNGLPKKKEFVLDFDWNVLPPWIDYIAMSRDGVWKFYAIKPCLNKEYGIVSKGFCWDDRDIAIFSINPEYAPKNFTGKWQDSLFKRPEDKIMVKQKIKPY